MRVSLARNLMMSRTSLVSFFFLLFLLSVAGLLVADLVPVAGLAAVAGLATQTAPPAVEPANMRPTGSVDERFQSYNVEMVEVTGGRFWKPYTSAVPNDAEAQRSNQPGATPSGMDPN